MQSHINDINNDEFNCKSCNTKVIIDINNYYLYSTGYCESCYCTFFYNSNIFNTTNNGTQQQLLLKNTNVNDGQAIISNSINSYSFEQIKKFTFDNNNNSIQQHSSVIQGLIANQESSLIADNNTSPSVLTENINNYLNMPVDKNIKYNSKRQRKHSVKIPGVDNSSIKDKINNIENRVYLFDQDSDDNEELVGIWIEPPTYSEIKSNKLHQFTTKQKIEFMYLGTFPATILAFNQSELDTMAERCSQLLGEVTYASSQTTNVIDDPGDIISRDAQMFLIELYFKFHHLSYPVLDREMIIDDFINNRLSKILLYAICCIAYYYIFLEDQQIVNSLFDEDLLCLDSIQIIKHFEMQAQFYLNDVFSRPDIQTVQALILLAGNSTSAVTSPEIWLYSGMATRMAMDMGLNRQVDEKSNLSEREIELRKLVWWGCFVLDTLYSIIICRPLSLQLSQCDIDYPKSFHTDNNTIDLFSQQIKLVIIASKINHLTTSVKLKSSLEDRRNRALDCLTLLKNWYSGFMEVCRNNTEDSEQSSKSQDYKYVDSPENLILYNHYYYFLLITDLIYICDNSFRIPKKQDIKRVNPHCLKIINYYAENVFLNTISTPTKVFSIFYCSLICLYNLRVIIYTEDLKLKSSIDALVFWYKNLASCYCTMLNIQSDVKDTRTNTMKQNNSNTLAQVNKDFSKLRNANAFVAMSFSIGLSEYIGLPLTEIHNLQNTDYVESINRNNSIAQKDHITGINNAIDQALISNGNHNSRAQNAIHELSEYKIIEDIETAIVNNNNT